MSDLIERPTDAADPTYPDAERCAQTLENCEDDLLTEAQFVRWQGQEIERLRQWETCGQEWLGKTDWVQDRVDAGSWPISALGKHRADVMREEIERLTDENKMLRHTHRWNVSPQVDDSLLVCRHLHEKDEKCDLEHYVPAGRLHDAIRERDELRRQLAEAEQRFDWLTERLEDVQIDDVDPNDHYYDGEEDVPFPILWRRAIDAIMRSNNE